MGTATRLLLVVDALLFISSCQDRFEKVCETASFFFFFGCHFVTFCSTFITDAHFARFTNKKSRQHFRCRTRDKETIFSSSSSSSSSIDVRKRHVVCVCVCGTAYLLVLQTCFCRGRGEKKVGRGENCVFARHILISISRIWDPIIALPSSTHTYTPAIFFLAPPNLAKSRLCCCRYCSPPRLTTRPDNRHP